MTVVSLTSTVKSLFWIGTRKIKEKELQPSNVTQIQTIFT